MKEYHCPRCGYVINHKRCMKDHINRKKMCNPVLSDLDPKDCINDILTGVIINNPDKKKIKKLEAENKQLKKQLKELSSKCSVTNNIGTINNNKTIVNITLPYNKTNHEFLTDKDYTRCINRMIMSVPNLIKRIHFNPQHPENHNIYINDMSRNLIMVYDGSQWNVQNQKDTIDRLINDHDFLLDEWVECGAEQYPDAMEKFKDYVELRSKNEVEEKIKDEVRYILYNNKDLVCKK